MNSRNLLALPAKAVSVRATAPAVISAVALSAAAPAKEGADVGRPVQIVWFPDNPKGGQVAEGLDLSGHRRVYSIWRLPSGPFRAWYDPEGAHFRAWRLDEPIVGPNVEPRRGLAFCLLRFLGLAPASIDGTFETFREAAAACEGHFATRLNGVVPNSRLSKPLPLSNNRRNA